LAKMTRLKRSPIFRNMFDFHDYKLCDVLDDERGIRCMCGYRGVEKLDFVDKYSTASSPYDSSSTSARCLCPKTNLTSRMLAADVAKINWKTAKRIDKKYLSKLVTGIDDLSPKKLGVDEIAYRKGHNYLTVVRDLDIGRVIWISRTRKNTALDAFFKELGAPKCSRIQVFVMDTWGPYISSVRENTSAEIVFDAPHRTEDHRSGGQGAHADRSSKADVETRKKYKKKRFLILKRRKKLDEGKRETLNALMAEN